MNLFYGELKMILEGIRDKTSLYLILKSNEGINGFGFRTIFKIYGTPVTYNIGTMPFFIDEEKTKTIVLYEAESNKIEVETILKNEKDCYIKINNQICFACKMDYNEFHNIIKFRQQTYCEECQANRDADRIVREYMPKEFSENIENMID